MSPSCRNAFYIYFHTTGSTLDITVRIICNHISTWSWRFRSIGLCWLPTSTFISVLDLWHCQADIKHLLLLDPLIYLSQEKAADENWETTNQFLPKEKQFSGWFRKLGEPSTFSTINNSSIIRGHLLKLLKVWSRSTFAHRHRNCCNKDGINSCLAVLRTTLSRNRLF